MQANFDLETNPAFTSAADEEFTISHGDLSQLGMVRTGLKPTLHFPIVENVVLRFAAAGKNPAWRQFTAKTANELGDRDIRLVVTTRKCQNLIFGSTIDIHRGVIGNLQKSLDPTTKTSLAAILSADRMIQAMKDLNARSDIDAARLAAYVNSVIPGNTALVNFLVNAGSIAQDYATVVSEQVIDGDAIRKLDYQGYSTLLNILGSLPNAQQKGVSNLDFLKLQNISADQEFVYEHPAIIDEYEATRRDLVTRTYTAPKAVDDWLSANSHGDLVDVKMYVAEDAVPIKVGREKILGEFAMYFLSLRQIVAQNSERAKEFAFSRMLVLRHGLFIDSEEVSNLAVSSELACTAAELDEWRKSYPRPEGHYVFLYASAISFLKSGHHATAANLDNTISKMMSAMNIPTSVDAIRAAIPFAVYNGPHVASMRMLLAFLLRRNTIEKVTNAIAFRLAPVPPMAAAYCNLEIFVEALAAAGFFDVMGRVQELERFRSGMRDIKSTMHYVAPYSAYLYGCSAADPLQVKNEVAKLAAYAAALTSALPNSTLKMSPALLKLAESQAKNSISATLHVQSYAAAFTRWARMTIEQALSKKHGARGQQQLLE